MRDRRFTAYLHFRLVICLYSAFMGMDKCKAPQFAVPAEFPLFESRATPECIYALNDVCGCGRVHFISRCVCVGVLMCVRVCVRVTCVSCMCSSVSVIVCATACTGQNDVVFCVYIVFLCTCVRERA